MNRIKTVLVVAGGKGMRMQADIPKQFIEIEGRPILMHTLETFSQYDAKIQLILVLPEFQIEFWKSLCIEHEFVIPHKIIHGGETRFHSVKNGLNALVGDGLVAIHDGVRPLVSQATIARCFKGAEEFGAAIPTIDLVESLRYVDAFGNKSVDRSAYQLVQTPQVFELKLLKDAYNQEFSPLFTDDASVVEAYGNTIHLVEGNRENIKITTAFDLQLAAFLMMNAQVKQSEHAH